jgi:Rieske Fe-S protein
MAGEDQERFEDYLELEHYLEELQAGHVAHPPDELTPSKARIYRMVALFRSAVPEESEPRPEFAAELKARLEQELHQPTKPPRFPFLAGSASGRSQRPTRRPERRLNISRRALLAGGAAAAASLVAGASIGAGIEEVQEEEGSNAGTAGATGWSSTLVNEGQGTWHFVTTLADLKDQAVRFVTDTIIGYVIRNDGDDPGDPAPVVAVSAACTHMGCIVQWQDSDRKFHCPCHGGLFTEYGKTDTRSPLRYLKPLPRLKTRVDEAGKVFVEVPQTRQLQNLPRPPKTGSWTENE